MKVIVSPSRTTWKELVSRPALDLEFLESTVKNIMNRVKKSGDIALRELTLQLDKVTVSSLSISPEDITAAIKRIDPELMKALLVAKVNIEKFHIAQRKENAPIETTPGVICWRKSVPIEKVGIYIPGGTAPLFSTVLMLGVPASLAGCQEVVLCSPPDAQGNVHDAILAAASLVGITKIFKVGGAQAIAAMTYGTESIPAVYKIFGPGNQYVTMAKQLVNQQGIAIDMPAGPSEVLVLADDTAEPSFIAADLLSQAEHGADSQVMLVLLSDKKLTAIQQELSKQLETLPRKKLAEQVLANSSVIVFPEITAAIDFVNEYAPEHLIISAKNDNVLADKIINAGSVFLGHYSPEAVGDYASGTNHTLPTNGYAKAHSGVSLESFMKQITFQRLTETGIENLGPTVEKMAEAEQLEAHKRAISIRLQKLSSKA
jgi:histidinol dehydrogenase